MPVVSRFFGLVINMYHNDHQPPHFHASYGEFEVLIEIGTLAVYEGSLPRRAMAMVLEWAAIHRQELFANWRRAERNEALRRIRPLS